MKLSNFKVLSWSPYLQLELSNLTSKFSENEKSSAEIQSHLENQVEALKAQKDKLENDLQLAAQETEQMKTEIQQLNEKATHLGTEIKLYLNTKI